MSLKRTSNAAGLPDRVVDAPCCWLCLEEGQDASGKPLYRNCSCRGTSGFAHLSCMINYAENKSRQACERNDYDHVAYFFRICPNCDQDYQDDVKYALAKARVEFVERRGYTNNHEMYLDAMRDNLYSLDFEEQDRPEGEGVYTKLLSIIEEVDEYQSLQDDRLAQRTAMSLQALGDFRTFGPKENPEEAKKHYERAKDLYDAIGDEVGVINMERYISINEAKLSGNEVNWDPTGDIAFWRKRYNNEIMRHGEDDVLSITEGISVSVALLNNFHAIEAERLLTKLVGISLRVHGSDHRITKRAVSHLDRAKQRLVFIGWSDEDIHNALRYENDGENCVVQGPLPADDESRNVDEEEILTVASKDMVPLVGTPVICHGLRSRSSSHLNGKIGDLRSYSEDRNRCFIHFEEEGLEPAEINVGSVSILFELPEER
eukprot:scaffold3543_cov90-Skeletonema_dohrnii-CCMP3373.AAC.4